MVKYPHTARCIFLFRAFLLLRWAEIPKTFRWNIAFGRNSFYCRAMLLVCLIPAQTVRALLYSAPFRGRLAHNFLNFEK